MKTPLALILLFLPRFLFAQICNGGLGTPIVNITFGAGSSQYGGALPAGVTNMGYLADQCPTDGNYTITNRTNGCYQGLWLNVSADHTGDPGGYFMLINASVDPSDFYTHTVTGLCPSVSYQFAAWVLNMASTYDQIKPNITFRIEKTDGTIIQSFQSGDVPVTGPTQWNQYAFYFTTPPGISSVVIRMRNNAPGGYGNDLAVDDITFRASGPPISIGIAGHPGSSLTQCPDPVNQLQLTGTVGSCYTNTVMQWQTSTDNGNSWNAVSGATGMNLALSSATSGTSFYRLAAAEAGNLGLSSCQVISQPVTISILPEVHPAITIQMDQPHVCADSLVTFTAAGSFGGPSPGYQWTVNGNPVGSGGLVFESSSLADGDQVRCSMTSNADCPKPAVSASNLIPVYITPNVTTSLAISNSANRICQDSLVNFTAFPGNGGAHPGYQWMINGSPVGNDGPVYSSNTLKNGDVVTAVMNSSLICSGPAQSNAITMDVQSKPWIRLRPDTLIAGGSTIELLPRITGDIVDLQWSPSEGLNDPGVLQPLANPKSTRIYQLQVHSSYGCAAEAKELVVVYYDLEMPNAFTPNGDGNNDLYRVPPRTYLTIIDFSIYNRWGGLVFSTRNSDEGWDGTIGGQKQPAGSYVWIISYYHPILKQMMKKKGMVELIR